jgi:predicted ATPase
VSLQGREAELEAIEEALDAVARGGRRLLMVRGEAGIGKTRLLAELRERAAAQRFVVLEGRATELERDVPFLPASTRSSRASVAAVRREVEALPDDARALVQAAAIAGDPFALDLAARIAELDQPAALAALDVVERHGLIGVTDDPRRFAFRHPVMRTAVHEALGAGARLAGHAAAARELARSGAPLAVQARHLVHAAAPGDAESAATLRAAAAAVRRQVPTVAADWLLAARRADPAGAEFGALAETLVEAGRLTTALEVVDEAPAQSAQMAVAAAGVERLLGRHDAARRRLERALEATAPGSRERARVLADLAATAYLRGQYGEMREWALQIERADSVDGVVRATYATLLAVGEA